MATSLGNRKFLAVSAFLGFFALVLFSAYYNNRPVEVGRPSVLPARTVREVLESTPVPREPTPTPVLRDLAPY